jgi:hypothetical protein
MCLDYIYSRNFFAKKGEGTAYKVFNNSALGPDFVTGTGMGYDWELNKWHKCRTMCLWVPQTTHIDKKFYLTGFHSIKQLHDARVWAGWEYGKVYKIEYKGLLATGMQNGFDIIISKYMKILEQVL